MIKTGPSRKGEPPHVTDEQIIEAIYQARGIKSEAAKIIGCNVTHFFKVYCKRPGIAEHVDMAREIRLDHYEREADEIAMGIRANSATSHVEATMARTKANMLQFMLERLARQRGYAQKVDVGALDPDGNPTNELKFVVTHIGDRSTST